MHNSARARLSGSRARLDATVLICTYNRAQRLANTLDSLAQASASSLHWNVIVVDNNSTDDTSALVASRASTFPVELRYIFEPNQGKSNALNTGLANTDAQIVVFTDDDVQVGENWLEAACRPLVDDSSIDYTGGPVRPIWEVVEPPTWFDVQQPDLWGTVALLDYGPDSFIFEERRRVPIGANMAVRTALVERIGGFDPALGRRGKALLGQEQAEFFCRSRAAGARGLYVPSMVLYHHVPAERLTRGYFRRWWYWKGVAKSRLERLHPETELGIDLRQVPKVAGIPRFMFTTLVRDMLCWLVALSRLDARGRMRHEMMLWYFIGYLVGARTEPRQKRGIQPATTL
jgi:glycosyltransferase involved in cell wall biosynthesis